MPIWRKAEEELGAEGLPPPYWAFAWAGGQALARYILDNPAIVAGKRVVDLAAGSGLDAIAAMRAGAAWPWPPTSTRSPSPPSSSIPLPTPSPSPLHRDLLAGCPAADVVIVGDIFYEGRSPSGPRLARRLPRGRADGAGRRSRPQLLSKAALPAGCRLQGASDARTRRQRDQAYTRLAVRGLNPAASGLISPVLT